MTSRKSRILSVHVVVAEVGGIIGREPKLEEEVEWPT